jgi:hypothetical protein
MAIEKWIYDYADKNMYPRKGGRKTWQQLMSKVKLSH